MHASPAADRPTDPVEDPKSVSIRVRTAAAGLAYILTVSYGVVRRRHGRRHHPHHWTEVRVRNRAGRRRQARPAQQATTRAHHRRPVRPTSRRTRLDASHRSLAFCAVSRSCCGTPGSTVRFKRRFGRVNPRRLPGPPKPAPDRDYRASLRTLLAAELLRRGEGLAHVAEVTGVPVALVELIRAEQVPEVPEPNTSRDRAGWESAAAASPSTKQSTNDETLH